MAVLKGDFDTLGHNWSKCQRKKRPPSSCEARLGLILLEQTGKGCWSYFQGVNFFS